MTSTLPQLQPSLLDVIHTSKQLPAADRLFLAKTLLDSLVTDERQIKAEPPMGPGNQSPDLAEVVAQIKATPPNPHQIQRATKTLDEVLATWEDSPTDEPRLTTEEWEQNWWAIRQEIKQRDQQPELFTDQIVDQHG